MTSVPIIDVARARNGDNRKPCHVRSRCPGVRQFRKARHGLVTTLEKGLLGTRNIGVITYIWLATPSTSRRR
jgi:hypothetical protein